MLRQHFESFIANKKGTSFSLDEFWLFVEEKVLEHIDEGSPPLGLGDYDQVKSWRCCRRSNGKLGEQPIPKQYRESRGLELEEISSEDLPPRP